MSEVRVLLAASFLRALAVGMSGVLLGIYLAKVGLTPRAVGLTLTAGLVGCALATLLATVSGDRFGRRRTLVLLSILSAGGAALASVASDATVLLGAAFVGMLNGMGRDRGAALTLEQAMLPGMVDDRGRTRVFAYYNVAQDAGHAVGAAAAAIPALLRFASGMDEVTSLRAAMLFYCAFSLAAVPLYLRLGPSVEAARGAARVPLSPKTRSVLVRISSLFALDAVAGGFLLTSLLAFYFYERWHVGEAVVGALFVGARVMNAFSHLGAAYLARRIGLVNTMVFTHIPASLLLMTVTIAPSFLVAALLFLLREGLVEMDVPTRQSYVMALVSPDERTTASGVTALVRMAGWSISPALAGLLVPLTSLSAPLFLGAAMKITYDLLLWRSFRHLRPPEEQQ